MIRHAWPLTLAVREGAATARTGRWTSLLVIIATAWTVAAPGAVDAVGVTRLIESEGAWIDAGGHVFVVTGGRVDGAVNPVLAGACERLSDLDGIEASFALRHTSTSGTLSHIPGGRALLYEVSPGVLTFLGLDAARSGVLVATSGFAARTGVVDLDTVAVFRAPSSETTPANLAVRVSDATVMGDAFDGAVLVPSLVVGEADVCYVRTDAPHHEAVEAALPYLLAYDGMPAIPNPRLFVSEFAVDYAVAYEDRPLRWLWVPAAAVLGLLWAMLQWFRRSHVAIYATFGMRAASRLVMEVSEWAVLGGIGLVWGWALGVAGALAFRAHVEQALTLVSAHATLTLLATSVIVVLLGLRPPGTLLSTLKDR